MKMKRAWTSCSIVTIIICSVSTVICIAILAGGYESAFNAVLHGKLQIRNGTKAEDMWENNPVPLVMKIYLFNITNPDDFQEGGVPQLEELGPYAYREYHHKENITYESNMTVTFYQKLTWVWDEEASENCSQDDILYTLNPIPVSAAFSAEDNAFVLSSLNIALNQINEKMVVSVTASEIIFDGFEDPMLDMMQSLEESGHESLVDIPPRLFHYDKFAWFYKRNESITFNGLFNMYTGESSLDDVGRINWWNYSNVTDYYEGSCNDVTGSAGALWPPATIDRSFIQFYNSDLCMSPKLYYKKDIEDSYGNAGLRFCGTRETFADKCFCFEESCISGLLDSRTCRMGTPVLISYPHFWDADPVLLENVEGLEPDGAKHEFFFDVNPDLGVPLRVAARLQINIRVKPYPGQKKWSQLGQVDILKSVPDVILPILWFEVSTEMTEEISEEIQQALFFLSPVILTIISCLLIVLIMVVGYCICKNLWLANREKKVF